MEEDNKVNQSNESCQTQRQMIEKYIDEIVFVSVRNELHNITEHIMNIICNYYKTQTSNKTIFLNIYQLFTIELKNNFTSSFFGNLILQTSSPILFIVF